MVPYGEIRWIPKRKFCRIGHSQVQGDSSASGTRENTGRNVRRKAGNKRSILSRSTGLKNTPLGFLKESLFWVRPIVGTKIRITAFP